MNLLSVQRNLSNKSENRAVSKACLMLPMLLSFLTVEFRRAYASEKQNTFSTYQHKFNSILPALSRP